MTTRLPSALHNSTTRRSESFCTIMALANTKSAHLMSDGLSGWMFISTSRRSHVSGSMAETVRRPSGGEGERLAPHGGGRREVPGGWGEYGENSKDLTKG